MQHFWRRLHASRTCRLVSEGLPAYTAQELASSLFGRSAGYQTSKWSHSWTQAECGFHAASSSLLWSPPSLRSYQIPKCQHLLTSLRSWQTLSSLQHPSCQPGKALSAASLAFSRGFAKRVQFAKHSVEPRFKGGKIRLRTAYKERFKAMADGTIRMRHPGFRHRRFRKTPDQRRRLRGEITMHSGYANVMKRMGFKMRG